MVKVKKKERGKKNDVSSETLLVALVAILTVMVACFGGNLLYLTFDEPTKRDTNTEKTPALVPEERSFVNYLQFVEKLDPSREVVYDAEEVEVNRYPFININNEEVSMINSEIRDLATNKINAGSNIAYEFGVYDKYLSVTLIENNGYCVSVFKSYLINLVNYELVSGEEVINEFDDNSKYELFLRVRDIVGSEFENELREEDSHDMLRNSTLENIYNYNLSASENDLYLIVNIESSKTCTKSLRINLENYTYSYFVI